MTFVYPNLKIYVDRKVVRYLPDKLDKNAKYTISFYIPLDNIDFQTGEKIEEAIKDISNRLSNFTILPLPRCLFRSNYPKNLSKKMIDKPKKFLIDGGNFRFLHDEETGPLKDRLKVFYKCLKCKFKGTNGQCEGIYVVEMVQIRKEKYDQWVSNEIPKQGCVNLLDLGCGDSSFIPLYRELAIRNKSLFVCMDPSDIHISRLNEKIQKDLESNILPLIGIGEHISLRDGIFDFVLVNYSYSHFVDIEKTMKNIYRVLKKGGVLLIFEEYFPEEDVKSEVKTEKKTWKGILLNQVEFRNHSPQDVVKILERYGFEILDSFKSEGKKRISWGIKSKKVSK